MKNNLRRLNLIFRFTNLKPEMFYSITFRASTIELQGKFNPEVIKQVKKMFNYHSISIHGYIEFKRYNLELIFTD